MKTVARKIVLTTHVVTSLGWFGAVAAFGVLSFLGLNENQTMVAHAAYVAMRPITWFVIVPLAFAALITGIVASLGTQWGLIRYYWVAFKLVITVAAIAVLFVHTEPIDDLASLALRGLPLGLEVRDRQNLLVIASGLTLAVLMFLTVLSIFKPRGQLPFAHVSNDMEKFRGP